MRSCRYLKNGEEYIIREALVCDAEPMISYLDAISSESDNLTFGSGEIDVSINDEKLLIENSFISKHRLLLVAVYQDKIIGNLNFKSESRPRISHVGEFGVSVLKDFWGNGIGVELIQILFEWAKENGITKINLKVKEDNTRAISLYRKLGFEQEGTLRRDFFIDGSYFSSVIMGKLID